MAKKAVKNIKKVKPETTEKKKAFLAKLQANKEKKAGIK